MTPPEAPVTRDHAEERTAPAGSPLSVLRHRRDFLAAAQARRAPVTGFLVQARARAEGEGGEGIRVGFTCSKKVGNAVTRNRAKRRLRALAAELVPQLGRPGWDYVLIGKAEETVSRPFDALRDDLRRAFTRLHG